MDARPVPVAEAEPEARQEPQEALRIDPEPEARLSAEPEPEAQPEASDEAEKQEEIRQRIEAYRERQRQEQEARELAEAEQRRQEDIRARIEAYRERQRQEQEARELAEALEDYEDEPDMPAPPPASPQQPAGGAPDACGISYEPPAPSSNSWEETKVHFQAWRKAKIGRAREEQYMWTPKGQHRRDALEAKARAAWEEIRRLRAELTEEQNQKLQQACAQVRGQCQQISGAEASQGPRPG